jgi:hypothetical protein
MRTASIFTSRRQSQPHHQLQLIPTICGFALGLASFLPGAFAQSDDELNSLIETLAMVKARISVNSEICKVDIDPMLEGRVHETLLNVPSLHISDVISHFAMRRQIEAHAAGTECHPGANENLQTLETIYGIHIGDLRKLVASKYAE